MYFWASTSANSKTLNSLKKRTFRAFPGYSARSRFCNMLRNASTFFANCRASISNGIDRRSNVSSAILLLNMATLEPRFWASTAWSWQASLWAQIRKRKKLRRICSWYRRFSLNRSSFVVVFLDVPRIHCISLLVFSKFTISGFYINLGWYFRTIACFADNRVLFTYCFIIWVYIFSIR